MLLYLFVYEAPPPRIVRASCAACTPHTTAHRTTPPMLSFYNSVQICGYLIELWNTVGLTVPTGQDARSSNEGFHVKCRAAWGESLLSLPRRWLAAGVRADGEDGADHEDFQLPKLPVPELQATMTTYLEYAAVLVPPPQLAQTRALVQEFLADQGPRLQEVLLERHKEMDNWVSVNTHYFLQNF
ncbi:Choline O-acetyltransferase [Papilio xuthus]|uniref:Choline O-acetyltransferase n=1 Tax=Papilio xuthus TaxID=66420 RepID=A0A194Q1U8_PAPXU|nr:Choline O-acetyltransferase [Papilio xuthus]